MSMMLWRKNSGVFKKHYNDWVWVCLLVNEPSATTQSQRETHCLWMFLYESEYIPLAISVLNSLFVHFLGTIMNQAVRAASRPWWDSLERSFIYTVCIYPWKAHCRDEECYKTEKDKCQGCSWGTLRGAVFSHLWGASPLAGRDVSTCV